MVIFGFGFAAMTVDFFGPMVASEREWLPSEFARERAIDSGAHRGQCYVQRYDTGCLWSSPHLTPSR